MKNSSIINTTPHIIRFQATTGEVYYVYDQDSF